MKLKVTTNSRHLETIAFCQTVDAIRKAQGKHRPENFPPGSLARMLAEVELISDTVRMLALIL